MFVTNEGIKVKLLGLFPFRDIHLLEDNIGSEMGGLRITINSLGL